MSGLAGIPPRRLEEMQRRKNERKRMFDKRDDYVEEVDRKHREGELTLGERHKAIEKIQTEFQEALKDLDKSA
jgi:DNA-directed RNA polymerase beta' subunit